MRILGIETSCDETAAAVVELTDHHELRIRSNIVASQVDLHRQYGGVVPEVAARSHLEVILPTINQALQQAGQTAAAIDGLAVTYGPGLPGALLIGVETAKVLATCWQKPLIAVDHVHAHVYAAWLNQPLDKQPKFPLLGLIVSGGHTQLVHWEDHLHYRLLGQTQDDAAGEAFDKVAKMLGLGFPGGPAVTKAAQAGDSDQYRFPIPQLSGEHDFSFSGLKTAVLRHLQKLTGQDYDFPSFKLASLLSPQQIADTAASFETTAIEILLTKTKAAVRQYQPSTIVVAGGVAANQALRQRLAQAFGEQVTYPPLELCTDNAAMIAALGVIQLQDGRTTSPQELEATPSLSM